MNKPPRHNSHTSSNSGEEETTIVAGTSTNSCDGSTSAGSSIFAPIPSQSSVVELAKTQGRGGGPVAGSGVSEVQVEASAAFTADSMTTTKNDRKLQFDHSKIHGRQKELSILEAAVKSMTPSGRHRPKEEASDGQKTEPEKELEEKLDDKRGGNEEEGVSPAPAIAPPADNDADNQGENKKERKLILLSGYSGTGKSILAHSLRHVVEHETMNGTFVTGKFDQCCLQRTESSIISNTGTATTNENTTTTITATTTTSTNTQQHQQQPYTAFRSICDGLVRRVVALKTATTKSSSSSSSKSQRRLFEQLKDQLMMELGTELMDLIQVFPSLDGLLATTSRGHHQGSIDSISGQIDTFGTSKSLSSAAAAASADVLFDVSERQHQSILGSVNSEARYRFKFIFGVLIRIMASALSPLVLVIDDMQWADAASLDLLESLLSNREIENTMVIGIYRSNEVDETHLLSKTLRDIRSNHASSPSQEDSGLEIIELEVGNLDMDAVHELLASVLLSSSTSTFSTSDDKDLCDKSKDCTDYSAEDKDRIWPLAELCYKKTAGNPFYLTHFVSRLYEMRMLSYDETMQEWTWDGQRIELYTNATQNVVDLLKQSMTSSLSFHHQTLLKFASFLGSMFEERPIYVLWHDFNKNNYAMNDKIGNYDHNLNSNTTAAMTVTKQQQRKRRKSRLLMSNKQRNSNRRGSRQSKGRAETAGGNNADETNIDNGYDDDDDDEAWYRFESLLKSCQDAGFWERSGEQTYRWVHDKLQEAAMDLVDPREQRDFSQHVAEVLTSQLSDNELESLLFVLVDRFNGGKLPKHRSKRMDLAKLNLRAADKAVLYSAFESAASYCRHGIRLLPDNCWESDYDLSLKLYSLGAETEGFLGNVHVMEEYCNEVLRQKEFVLPAGGGGGKKSSVAANHSLRFIRRGGGGGGGGGGTIPKSGDGRRGGVRDKFRVYNVMMLSIANRNLPNEALTLCVDVLGRYGVKFPKTIAGITCRIGINVIKIKSTIKSRTKEEIENLQVMNDPIRIEQMGLLDKMATYCYLTQSSLYPLVAFKMLEWTMEYGYCKFSPVCFGMTALILSGVLGDLAGGTKYGNFALILLNKLDPATVRVIEARTAFLVYNFALHWANPLKTMLSPALRGYEVGMQCGDTESAMFNLYSYIFTAFISGVKLTVIERDCRIYRIQMKKLKQDIVMIQCHMTWQVILNLMGQSHHKTTLTGTALNEDACREEAKANAVLSDFLEVNKMILLSFFGEYKDAAEYAYRKGDSIQQTMPGMSVVPLYTFHRCLSLLAVARVLQEERSDVGRKNISTTTSSRSRSSSSSRRRGWEESNYIKSAKKALGKIKNWIEQENPQSRHYEPLLQAELAAYQGQSSTTIERHYTSAIQMSIDDGYIQDAALACERYGLYLLSQCDDDDDGDDDDNSARINAAGATTTDAAWRGGGGGTTGTVTSFQATSEERAKEGSGSHDDVNKNLQNSNMKSKRNAAVEQLIVSIKYYREWGAFAKASMLEEKYGNLYSGLSPQTK